MFFWILQPSRRKSQRQGNCNEHEGAEDHGEQIKQLPQEITPSCTLPAAPALPDVALLRKDAVKQDETHHAADVHHDETENDPNNHQHGNEAG